MEYLGLLLFFICFYYFLKFIINFYIDRKEIR